MQKKPTKRVEQSGGPETSGLAPTPPRKRAVPKPKVAASRSSDDAAGTVGAASLVGARRHSEVGNNPRSLQTQSARRRQPPACGCRGIEEWEPDRNRLPRQRSLLIIEQIERIARLVAWASARRWSRWDRGEHERPCITLGACLRGGRWALLAGAAVGSVVVMGDLPSLFVVAVDLS